MQSKGKLPTDDKWKAKYKEPVAPDTRDLPKLSKGWTWATIEQLLTNIQYGSSKKSGDDSERYTSVENWEYLLTLKSCLII